MYTKNDLSKYDYFNSVDMNYALDSLTGVLSRANILGFARHLVDNKTPFTMAILDIDNFKLVNDNYGHAVGDECLISIGENLARYVGNDGLVGRFGGDEFIILYFKSSTYDELHDYLETMLNEGNIVRRKLHIGNVCFFVTATVGCASFPKDCDNYDELFIIADKALYRGKTKGRNCFIIYVEEKHKNIEVHKKEQSSLPNILGRISELSINEKIKTEKKIKNILNYIENVMQISEAAFLSMDKKTITSGEGYDCCIDEECLEVFDYLTRNNQIYIPNELSDFSGNKKISTFVKDKKIITFIVSRVTAGKKTIGYLILFEGKITRIWQENDVALLLYLNKIIELLYFKDKKAV